MLGLGLGAYLGVCIVPMALPAFAQEEDASPPRVKVTGGPTKKADKKVEKKSAAQPDPAYEDSKRAYEALALADRKAVQDALVWVANYKGTVDGTFGKRTRDALVAYETRERINADGIVDAEELKRLKDAARRAREAVRFSPVADPATGMKLGLPLKLLAKRSKLPGGTRFFSAEQEFSVETRVVQEGDADLAKLFERLRRDGADRKVTYKASKADWFVVSGEAGDRHFYTRFERKPGADTGELRGYTITYAAADAATIDRYAIAIANAAEAFPTTPVRVAAKEASGAAVSAPEAPRPRPSATGVAVAPDRVLSVLPAACADPSRGKDKLKVIASDAASGLTLMEAPGVTPLAAAAGQASFADGESLVIVGYAAAADGRPGLTVAAGDAFTRTREGGKREARLIAPLQAGAAGSAVFDRAGAFRGVIGRQSTKPRLVAGIVPQASHPLVVGEPLESFLRAAGIERQGDAGAGLRTAGEIARMAQASLIPIDCAR